MGIALGRDSYSSSKVLATDQLADAVEHWVGLTETHGLARRTRDPLDYARAVIDRLSSDDPSAAVLSVYDWEPWVDGDLADIPPAWWATALGRLTLLAQPSGELSIPATRAALGLSRARVYELLAAGQLQRGPAGGITRRSIVQRLRRAY